MTPECFVAWVVYPGIASAFTSPLKCKVLLNCFELHYCRADVLAYDRNRGAHHLLYEDGEDEWIKLPAEAVAWHRGLSSAPLRAGLPPGETAHYFRTMSRATIVMFATQHFAHLARLFGRNTCIEWCQSMQRHFLQSFFPIMSLLRAPMHVIWLTQPVGLTWSTMSKCVRVIFCSQACTTQMKCRLVPHHANENGVYVGGT